ncbi:MAG TPA: GatB/YqeY domain-containing protein [Flavobacteriaceae bacterium]|nr:GatB/YqeY domain-containing protein [Flavobacteriaceae bacterium]
MSILKETTQAMKDAMRAKDADTLAALRAIRAAITNEQMELGVEELDEKDSIKVLQRLAKQRKDSAAIYKEQDRTDLVETELAQLKVIESYLPEQLSEEEVRKIVQEVIDEVGAEGMKDMGRVMGAANERLAGQADGKTIASITKSILA